MRPTDKECSSYITKYKSDIVYVGRRSKMTS